MSEQNAIQNHVVAQRKEEELKEALRKKTEFQKIQDAYKMQADAFMRDFVTGYKPYQQKKGFHFFSFSSFFFMQIIYLDSSLLFVN